MRASRRLRSLLLAPLLTLTLTVTALAPAFAERPAAPASASWTGYAFDTCSAPRQRVMDRWLAASPFQGVGVFIGGSMRACGQPHLSRRWVGRQTRNGWHLLPIWVGRQASCSGYRRTISPAAGARGLYPTADRQGRYAARSAVAEARALGIEAGSTLWYDLEAFSHGGNDRCRASALRFLSGWTEQLHAAGYAAGVYSSISAAIHSLDRARTSGRGGYTLPDHIWFAWANHRADVQGSRTWMRSGRWREDSRVHQYALDTPASYGGVRLHIDRSFVDLGQPPAAPGADPCRGRVEFRRYQPLHRGSTGRQVAAVQCLLEHAGQYDGAPSRTYGKRTWSAVRAFQADRRLPRTGRVDVRTWTALLVHGRHQVLKRGSTGAAVRRLQRALNAAQPHAVPVNGVFGPGTGAALARYQQRTGHPGTGVAAPKTWRALERGTVPATHHAQKHHAQKHHAKKHHGRR